MGWAKLKGVSSVLKPTLRLLDRFVIPLLATALFWTYLDKAIQILAVLVLSTLWLKYIGFDVDVAKRLSKTRFGKVFAFVIRSASPVSKMNEEYFEEAGRLLAEQTLFAARQVKKIEEEIRMMSRFKKYREETLLFLTHNKRMFTVYTVVILFALDMYFEWSQTYGLPDDVWYYVGALITFVVLWAAGGEGWTGNTQNRLSEVATSVKKDVRIESKRWQSRLDKVTVEIEEILADKVDGMIPPHLKQRYEDLLKSKDLYKKKIDELLSRLNPDLELK